VQELAYLLRAAASDGDLGSPLERLLVPGAVFWIGFDLPYPPIIALARTVLIVLSWSSLE
jgi:hypothetical protein